MNPREWLTNVDIERVMRQYQRGLRDFQFLGAYPIDFEDVQPDGKCVVPEMCAFDVARALARGVTRAGVVLNTDKHYQEGSHWVSLYIGLDPSEKNYGFCYYDSVARPPPAEVRRFHARVRDEVERYSPKQRQNADANSRGFQPATFELRVNEVRKQYKDTECGVYAMFALLCCVTGTMDFHDICRAMGDDDELHQMRDVFFRRPLTDNASTQSSS